MVNMPQRQRHNTGGGAGGAELPLLDAGVIEAHNAVTTTRCAVPLGCGCLKGYEPICLDSPTGCVRVQCNNEHCTVGTLMHGECFAAWEAHVLAYLRSCGRARSWSEKQRLQNLWTKRGYDLAYRACSCLCSRGHLRKDLDWSPPGEIVEHNDNKTKKKKKNRQNTKPTLVTVGAGALTVNNNNITGNNNNTGGPTMILGGSNNGSGSGGSSTPVCGQPCQRQRANSISSTGSSPPSDAPHSPHHTKNSRRQRDFFSDRTRNYLSDMSSPSEDDLFDIHHHGLDSSSRPHLHSHHPYSYVNSVEVSKAKIWRVRPRAKGSEALTLMTLTWTGRPPCSPGPAAAVQLQPAPMATPLHHQQRSTSPAADVNECTCNCLCSLGPTPESAALAKHQVTSSSSRSSSSSAMTVISPISGTSETVMDIPDNVPDAHTGASIVLVVLWITYCHLFGSPTLS